MSFRNTFTTDFIYQAADKVLAANILVTKIFEDWCASTLAAKVNERGYGHYAGWFKTSSGTTTEAEEYLRQIIPALEQATKVPFRLTVLLESGPCITYGIEPSRLLHDNNDV